MIVTWILEIVILWHIKCQPSKQHKGEHILFVQKKLNTVKTYLKNNGYPQKLMNKCNQEIIKPKFENDGNKRKVIATVPYIKGECIDKHLRPYVKIL